MKFSTPEEIETEKREEASGEFDLDAVTVELPNGKVTVREALVEHDGYADDIRALVSRVGTLEGCVADLQEKVERQEREIQQLREKPDEVEETLDCPVCGGDTMFQASDLEEGRYVCPQCGETLEWDP